MQKRYEIILTILSLTLITFILIYAPIKYKFVYPTYGFDSIRYVFLAETGEGIRNYGVWILKPFIYLGLEKLQIVCILYYGMLALSTLSVFLFSRRFGILCAVIMPLMTICSYGFYQYYLDSSIFQIAGLLIFGLWIFVLIAESEKDKRWYLLLIPLMIMALLFHKATAIFTLATILIYALISRNKILIAGLLCLLPLAYLVWGNDYDLINYAFLKLTWSQYLIGGFYIVAMGFILWGLYPYFKLLRTEIKLLILLGAISLIGMVVNLFPGYYYGYLRHEHNLLIVCTILIAYFVYYLLAIHTTQRKYSMLILVTVLSFVMLSLPGTWFSNFTSIKENEKDILNQINRLPSYSTIFIIPDKQQLIFQLFITSRVTYMPTYTVDYNNLAKQDTTYNKYEYIVSTDRFNYKFDKPIYYKNEEYTIYKNSDDR